MSTTIERGTWTLPVDLTEYEFDIKCEWEESDCDIPATLMSKGCGDDRHYAICGYHMEILRRWFDSEKPAVCICGRPFMFFETHYEISPI